MTVTETINMWIDQATIGHIKDGPRILSPEECALIRSVLICVAGDLSIATPDKPNDPLGTKEAPAEVVHEN